MDNLNAFLREKNLKVTNRELCTRLRQYYLFKQYHGGVIQVRTSSIPSHPTLCPAPDPHPPPRPAPGPHLTLTLTQPHPALNPKS
jgi:hypothetical protein